MGLALTILLGLGEALTSHMGTTHQSYVPLDVVPAAHQTQIAQQHVASLRSTGPVISVSIDKPGQIAPRGVSSSVASLPLTKSVAAAVSPSSILRNIAMIEIAPVSQVPYLPPLSSGQIRPSQWSAQPRSGVIYGGVGTLKYNSTVDGVAPWSFTSLDNNELRFEVRPGDRLYNPETGYQDPPTAERSEISFPSHRWANGTDVTLEYEFYIPSGFDFDTRWCTVGQMHSDNPSSPPFELAFRRGSGLNQLLMVRRVGKSNSPQEHEYAITSGPIRRDVWHKIRLSTKMGENGYMRVWFNGDQMLDFEGTVGYDDQTNWYWRMGVYRRATNQIYKIYYRNLNMRRI
jgi:Polysaccharide lyase